MSSNINYCQSGGAIGADTLWIEAAKRAGHEYINYVFETHRSSNNEGSKVLSQQDLNLADPLLCMANKVLKRKFPTKSDHVNNLLRRNYWQVKNTNSVYAVAGLDIDTGLVIGGTAWAIEVFKILYPDSNEIYLYDSRREQWFQWELIKWNKISLEDVTEPSGLWTGIGTRDIDSQGEAAILAVFNRNV